jgi:hypothetical protein
MSDGFSIEIRGGAELQAKLDRLEEQADGPAKAQSST